MNSAEIIYQRAFEDEMQKIAGLNYNQVQKLKRAARMIAGSTASGLTKGTKSGILLDLVGAGVKRDLNKEFRFGRTTLLGAGVGAGIGAGVGTVKAVKELLRKQSIKEKLQERLTGLKKHVLG